MLLPEDDLNLAEMLKSPLWNLNDADLFALCYQRGELSLWRKLRSDERYAEVATQLQQVLDLADQVRPFEFYSFILNKLGGRRKFVARIGHEAEDGIDEFVNLSLAFEKEHVPSMQAFVEWMEQDDVEIKRELEQSQADAVRIMTVHGSKGLQAPVVILPDTVRIKSIRNEAGLLFDDGIMLYPFGSDEYEDNCRQIKQKEKRLSVEEYHRLLYVALTRAEELLCICGYQRGNKVSDESWYELCRQSLRAIAVAERDNLVYEVKQEAPLPLAEKSDAIVEKDTCGDWINSPAPVESALAKPLTPSKDDEEEEINSSPLEGSHTEYFRRGLIIHKLLQFIPDVAGGERVQKAAEFVARQAENLSVEAREQLCNEVINLVEDERFAPLFGSESRAEVPIMGEVNGRIISGQIDRLAVLPDKVMIVDFKTNRPATQVVAQVPSAYVRQLSAYRALVEKIYPNRKVETYILWTNTAVMMKIE